MTAKSKAAKSNAAARYFLTRQSALALRGIHDYSSAKWGARVANAYIKDLYAATQKAAANPEAGRLRQQRATPFLMVPARQHFIIYDTTPQGVVILAVENQVRDIEALIATLTPAFLAEVKKLKRGK